MSHAALGERPGRNHLRQADALQVATRCTRRTAFVTNDIQLRRVVDEIDIVILDEFISRCIRSFFCNPS